MSIWQQLWVPWQKWRGKNNYKTTNSEPQNAAPKSTSKKIQIITDDPAEEDALYFGSYSKNLANIIREAKPKFAIGIFGKWGTGKTTLMKMIKQELEKDEDKDKILTVWFDAWRYEKEKYLAVIPFLRQIRIALEKDLGIQKKGVQKKGVQKKGVQKKGKSKRWKVLRAGLEKTFTAFMVSTEFSVSPAGSPVSTSTSLEKFYDSLKSKGSVFIDGERKQFHEHSTDYLKAALNELGDARIVVFVDDLDRCTPQNALEVIESIKTFFDIEGIIYVIGMDSESIDHIIKQKYGDGSNNDDKSSNIDGLSYLQKIVQLPFQIPVWKTQDIRKAIPEIISKGLKDQELIDEFLKRKELIVKAIEPNLRQLKRFINNIILAREVFGKQIEIDKLIAVQALNFRPKWNKFLELISENDITRKNFFEKYYLPPKGKGKSIYNKDALDSYIKEETDPKTTGQEVKVPMSDKVIDIFQELILNQKDSTLRHFLDDAGAAEILRDIDKMEDYRRALEATKFKEEEKLLTGEQKPRHEHLFELLKKGRINEFNEMRSQYPSPNLSDANLSHARLVGANLSDANLGRAYLGRAFLSGATLSGATLSGATLSHANLSYASLVGANLSNADLSGATLFLTMMIGLRFDDNESYPLCNNARFDDATIIDDQGLYEHFRKNSDNPQSVPPAARDKKELRQKLKQRVFDEGLIEQILSYSRLTE